MLHALTETLPADLWAHMANGSSYTFHLSAVAALDTVFTRSVNFSLAGATNFVEILSLPASEDFDEGTTFKLYGLP